MMNNGARRREHMDLPEAKLPARLQHEEFAEEAQRVAHRYLEQRHQIEELTNERDEWRRKALLAEEQNARLERREIELTRTLGARAAELERERDQYKMRLAKLVGQFEAAGSIVLRCIEIAHAQVPDTDLRALAAEQTKHADTAEAPAEEIATEKTETEETASAG